MLFGWVVRTCSEEEQGILVYEERMKKSMEWDMDLQGDQSPTRGRHQGRWHHRRARTDLVSRTRCCCSPQNSKIGKVVGGGPDPFCLSVILRTSVWNASWIKLRLESLPHEVWRVLQSAGVEGGHAHGVTGEEGVELHTWNSSVRTRWRSCNQGKQRYTKNIERFARFKILSEEMYGYCWYFLAWDARSCGKQIEVSVIHQICK